MPNPRIDTYLHVTENGTLNPFADVADVAHYGNTAQDYHEYLLAFHADMPVYNDYTRLHAQILRLFTANKIEWETLYGAIPAENAQLNNRYSTTETVTHSGTDSTETGGGATDKANTYDNATMRNTHQTITNNNGSFTYGHEIETVKQLWPEGDPVRAMDKIIDVSRKSNVFTHIMDTIIANISCKVYTSETLGR